MSNKKTIEALVDYLERNPWSRVGQAIVNVTKPNSPVPKIFYVEDSELAVLLRNTHK